jgi:bifunctional ADP-heptose synthase (sugar kinase/adenylyltransferase)
MEDLNQPTHNSLRPDKLSYHELLGNEVFTWKKVLPELQELHSKGTTIVVTNGHFVLKQPGHASSFDEARKAGKLVHPKQQEEQVILVVIVNNDNQTNEKSPVKAAAEPAEERAFNVYRDMAVDFTVISQAPEGDRSVCPDIKQLIEAGVVNENFLYTKGGDYGDDNLPPEAQLVQDAGGNVQFLNRNGGFSTSGKIARIIEAAKKEGRI